MKMNDLFDYGLYIYQCDNTFKFNLDSILLAEFIRTNNNDKIIDFCSGNAVIPLILTTKNKDLKIDVVEVQKKISEIAKKNVNINNLNDLISVHNKNISKKKKRNYYDIVSCNPPYFKDSKLNKQESICISRHEILIDLETIINMAKKVLNPTGKLYLVHKPERMGELFFLLKKYNFGLRRVNFIFTSNNKSAKLILVEAIKSKKDNIVVNYKNIYKLNSYKNIFD